LSTVLDSHQRDGPSDESGHAAWIPPSILLEAIGGDDKLIVELIDAFHEDTETRLAVMRAAIEAADRPLLRREAHSIKGSAQQIGAQEIAATCEQIELTCMETPSARQTESVNRLDRQFHTIVREMAHYGGRP